MVANGPQSPVAPAVSKSSTQTTTTTTRPSSSAYAAAASGQTVSSPWSTTSGTSLQPQTFNSMGESPKPPSSFQPVPSGLLQQDHQDQEQMLHQGVQSVLSNHQTTSPPSSSNGQGHIRNVCMCIVVICMNMCYSCEHCYIHCIHFLWTLYPLPVDLVCTSCGLPCTSYVCSSFKSRCTSPQITAARSWTMHVLSINTKP